MAPANPRKDANTWPSVPSTFWAVIILVSFLIAYCRNEIASTHPLSSHMKNDHLSKVLTSCQQLWELDFNQV